MLEHLLTITLLTAYNIKEIQIRNNNNNDYNGIINL